MQVLDKSGIHLPEFDLWLDPHHTRPVAFVSHAHADHMKKHGRVFATPATADMMRARGATKSHFHHLGWREEVKWNRAQVSFFPAGHVLGSAQMLVESEGARLLYSGDFKMRDGLSCEPIEVPRADILIMETTFGRPHYRFPKSCEVLEQIRNWCAQVLGRDAIPAIFCYSLGKGQEVLAGLNGCDFPIFLHAKHGQISDVYARHGVEFPDFKIHEVGIDIDGVLLCASQCKRAKWWQELTQKRRVETAYVSGWALNSHPARFGADAAFALSDHAGYDDLWKYVRQSGAQKVWTTHGFDAEFAADLRAAGIEAAPLRTAKLEPTGRQLCLF
ncbi:MAG TPA: MBL fold metallo-hydrolase [Abditibacterium sp.]